MNLSDSSYEDLEKLEILRHDDPGGYENSGYILMLEDKEYTILRFSHCSCYGTWDGSSVVFKGTKKQIKDIAKNEWDLNFIGQKKIDKKDYDYRQIKGFYEKIMEHFEKGR